MRSLLLLNSRHRIAGYNNKGAFSHRQAKEAIMPEAFILSAARTPIGKYLGSLAEVPAPELGAAAVREVLRRARVPPERVDEVIIGNVLQAGVGQNPARQVALKAG